MHRSFSLTVYVTVILFLAFHDLNAQNYLPQALITNDRGFVTVSANDPRPLAQASTALTYEYGWTIDYEDPVYPKSASRDVTAASWRLAHPHEQGALIPAGSSFIANLGEVVSDAAGKARALSMLVEQYNRSPNPGTFAIITSKDGRTLISGQSGVKGIQGGNIMDASFQPSSKTQTAGDALQDLAMQCGSRVEIPIVLGTVPSNTLYQTLVPGSKDSLSCRNGLGRILSAIPHTLSYSLLYDIGMRTYILNIGPVDLLRKDINGKNVLIPVKK